MSAVELKKGELYAVGALNPSMRIFDIVMKTEYGSSYNAYLLRGTEKTALIEACHRSFFEPFVNNIKQVCEPSEIDYIVLNHCEPDHSGVLEKLLPLCPKATVVATRPGSIYLKKITNLPDLPVLVATEQTRIDLGGKELSFLIAPFLHWPDTMFTWCGADNALFSCDFLGAHFCEPYLLDKNSVYPDKYRASFQEYYDTIFRPFQSYVRKGLEKIKDLDIAFACVSHGPILTKEGFLGEALRSYERWSRPVERAGKQIPVFYCSAYGNTGLIAKQIKQGILSVIPGAACEVFDINDVPMGELAEKLNACDALCVGSPTINADAVSPVWELLSHTNAIGSRGKNAMVFGSYGWSGEAVPNLCARLAGLKMNVYGDGLKIQFVPSQKELDEAKRYGAAFAERLAE